MKNRHLVRILWRWHKRVGVLAAVLAIFLAVTGLLLNHSSQWGWDSQPISSAWVLKRYGYQGSAEIAGIRVGEHWWTISDTKLFFDSRVTATCEDHWRLPISISGWVITACEQKISLWLADGRLVETLYEVPSEPLNQLAFTENGVPVFQYGDVYYALNVDMLTLEQISGTIEVRSANSNMPPKELVNTITEQAIPPELNWERWLLDIHSGRWFGLGGTLLADLTALLIIVLSVSGLLLYFLRGRR